MAKKAKVICISNQKGGAGKTTITHNLGCTLALEHGAKVLFVDMDGQANLTVAFGLNPDQIEQDAADLLAEPVDIAQIIRKSTVIGADLIPSTQHVFGLEKRLQGRLGAEFLLSEKLEPIKKAYDYIFIDTPPSLNIATVNALIAANYVLLVLTASEFSLDGLSQILATLDEIQANPRMNINKTRIAGAVINRYQAANKKVNRALLESLDGLEETKRRAIISQATAIEQAQFAHKPIIEHTPGHKVAGEFRDLAKELKKWLD